MRYRPVTADDLDSLARFAEPLQERPERHVIYLAESAGDILMELEETAHHVASLVAETDAGAVEGWLIGDVDDELGRVWWLGPFVAADEWQPLATELLHRCRALLPSGVDQEEMAVDARFTELQPWAEAEGFETIASGSWVLSLDADVDVGPCGIDVRPAGSDDAELVTLHERLFRNSHTTGRRLIESTDDRHLRLIAESEGELVGYVAVERQGNAEGYIDFLGVTETRRGRGIGRELVRAGVAALRDLGVTDVHLTVREENDGARRLYDSLGFTTVRLIRPYRIGFELV